MLKPMPWLMSVRLALARPLAPVWQLVALAYLLARLALRRIRSSTARQSLNRLPQSPFAAHCFAPEATDVKIRLKENFCERVRAQRP